MIGLPRLDVIWIKFIILVIQAVTLFGMVRSRDPFGRAENVTSNDRGWSLGTAGSSPGSDFFPEGVAKFFGNPENFSEISEKKPENSQNPQKLPQEQPVTGTLTKEVKLSWNCW